MSMTDADGWYEELMNGHRELTDDQSARLNCALVLLLADQRLRSGTTAPLHRRGACGRKKKDLVMDAMLDAGRLRGQSLLVCVCTFSVMILDGFDVQIIGFAAPALVAEFGIERSALGPALAASVLGMCLGAMAIGRIGDRFGRRPALLLSTVLFGATTLLGATANDVTSLAAWRFLTGLGLGAALPSAVALMAEFAPANLRSQLIVGSLLGVPIGGILGSALAAELVPVFGWQAIFIVGGLLPLVAAAALLPLLPESPRFLAARGEAGPLRTITCAFHAVFAPGLARDAWIMALAFFTNMIAVYAFFSWVPLVLTSVGFPLDQAVRSALVFNLAGVAGSLLNAWLIARIGSRLPLVAVASVAIFALVGLTCVAALGARRPAFTAHHLLLHGDCHRGLWHPCVAVGPVHRVSACVSHRMPDLGRRIRVRCRAYRRHPQRFRGWIVAGHGRRGRILPRPRDCVAPRRGMHAGVTPACPSASTTRTSCPRHDNSHMTFAT